MFSPFPGGRGLNNFKLPSAKDFVAKSQLNFQPSKGNNRDERQRRQGECNCQQVGCEINSRLNIIKWGTSLQGPAILETDQHTWQTLNRAKRWYSLHLRCILSNIVICSASEKVGVIRNARHVYSPASAWLTFLMYSPFDRRLCFVEFTAARQKDAFRTRFESGMRMSRIAGELL